MSRESISDIQDEILANLMSTPEGVEVYLRTLVEAVDEVCTKATKNKIEMRHFELIVKDIQGN